MITQEEYDALLQKLKEKEVENKQLKRKNENLQSRCNKLFEKNNVLVDESEEIEEKLESTKEKLQNTQHKLENQRSLNKEFFLSQTKEVKIQEIEKNLQERFTLERDFLEGQCETLSQHIKIFKEQQKQGIALTMKAENEIVEAKAQVADYEEKLETANETIKDLNNQLGEIQGEYNTLNSNQQRYVEQIKKLREKAKKGNLQDRDLEDLLPEEASGYSILLDKKEMLFMRRIAFLTGQIQCLEEVNLQLIKIFKEEFTNRDKEQPEALFWVGQFQECTDNFQKQLDALSAEVNRKTVHLIKGKSFEEQMHCDDTSSALVVTEKEHFRVEGAEALLATLIVENASNKKLREALKTTGLGYMDLPALEGMPNVEQYNELRQKNVQLQRALDAATGHDKEKILSAIENHRTT